MYSDGYRPILFILRQVIIIRIVDTDRMNLKDNKTAAEEYAVAININDINYAVMMLSPYDLEDYVAGFLFSEQVIENRYDIHDLEISLNDQQCSAIINCKIANRCLSKLKKVGRQLQGTSSCGICGVKSLEQALPELVKLEAPTEIIDNERLLALKADINNWQLRAEKSGAMHAALLIKDNHIIACREDIGRHNALDKLIGYKVNNQIGSNHLAVLLTSRCSVELVHKVVIAKINTLITLASPSQLAINRALQANLTLVHIPKYDQPIWYMNKSS